MRGNSRLPRAPSSTATSCRLAATRTSTIRFLARSISKRCIGPKRFSRLRFSRPGSAPWRPTTRRSFFSGRFRAFSFGHGSERWDSAAPRRRSAASFTWRSPIASPTRRSSTCNSRSDCRCCFWPQRVFSNARVSATPRWRPSLGGCRRRANFTKRSSSFSRRRFSPRRSSRATRRFCVRADGFGCRSRSEPRCAPRCRFRCCSHTRTRSATGR